MYRTVKNWKLRLVMQPDPGLGAVLRATRVARGLTLNSVARRARCSESLLSHIETGSRALRPGLARTLDEVLGTGTALTLLADGHYRGSQPRQVLSPAGDVILVHLRGLTVPVSRRELLAGLGIGAMTGALASIDRAFGAAVPDESTLSELESTLTTAQAAGRTTAPAILLDPLTGHVAIIDTLRRRAPAGLQQQFLLLQIRNAETLSWMAEEAGELDSAVYWTDRTYEWAAALPWPAMIAYTHVRRSMLALTFANDGYAAVRHAAQAERIPEVPARVAAMAAKQMAFGHALSQQPTPSRRALDRAARWLSHGEGQAEQPAVGQHSVRDDDLLAIYTATCDVYLGGGSSVISTLTPRLTGIAAGSPRTRAITIAKLALAHANAGDPAGACSLALDVLDGTAAVQSQSARAELRRLVPALRRWPARSDIAEVAHRLTAMAS